MAEGHTVSLVSFSTYRSYPPVVRHIAFARAVWLVAKSADYVIALDTWSVALPAVLVARLLKKRACVRCGGDFVWERYVERTKREVTLTSFYVSQQPLSLYERCVVFITRRIIFALPDKVVFSTEWQKGFTSLAYGIPPEKTVVIENMQPMRVTPLAPSGTHFVWIGRPLFLKNTARLKRAFGKAHMRCPDIALNLISNVPQEEAHRALARAWALVLPSLSEVSPNLAFEAIAMGVPVILTKETGSRDALKDSVLFVDPLSEREIEEAMVRLTDPRERNVLMERMRALPWGRTYRDIAREFLVLCGA